MEGGDGVFRGRGEMVGRGRMVGWVCVEGLIAYVRIFDDRTAL